MPQVLCADRVNRPVSGCQLVYWQHLPVRPQRALRRRGHPDACTAGCSPAPAKRWGGCSRDAPCAALRCVPACAAQGAHAARHGLSVGPAAQSACCPMPCSGLPLARRAVHVPRHARPRPRLPSAAQRARARAAAAAGRGGRRPARLLLRAPAGQPRAQPRAQPGRVRGVQAGRACAGPALRRASSASSAETVLGFSLAAWPRRARSYAARCIKGGTRVLSVRAGTAAELAAEQRTLLSPLLVRLRAASGPAHCIGRSWCPAWR